MTALTNDTLTAIGRELSVVYLPTVREPLPSELKDLVAQLVVLETGRRGSSARSADAFAEALQPVRAQSVVRHGSIGRSIGSRD
jgi:hypothetical protein